MKNQSSKDLVGRLLTPIETDSVSGGGSGHCGTPGGGYTQTGGSYTQGSGSTYSQSGGNYNQSC